MEAAQHVSTWSLGDQKKVKAGMISPFLCRVYLSRDLVSSQDTASNLSRRLIALDGIKDDLVE